MSESRIPCIFIQLEVSVYLRTIQEKGIGSMLPGSPKTSDCFMNSKHAAKCDLFSSSQSQGTCISPNVDPKKSVLITITKHEWSSVYISGLPKKSREEAMKLKELLTNNIKEQQCKSCQIPHRHKVAEPCCTEDLPSKLKKLLMPHELRTFFDKRAIKVLESVWIGRCLTKSPICPV